LTTPPWNPKDKILTLNVLAYSKVKVKVKGKSISLKAWKGQGQEGSRRLRLLDFKTIGT
jgi:hypothetical protein